jgi:hypothetical protein
VKWAPLSSSASCSEAVIPWRRLQRLQPSRLQRLQRLQPSRLQRLQSSRLRRQSSKRQPRRRQVPSVAQEWGAGWQAAGPSSLACGACCPAFSHHTIACLFRSKPHQLGRGSQYLDGAHSSSLIRWLFVWSSPESLWTELTVRV